MKGFSAFQAYSGGIDSIPSEDAKGSFPFRQPFLILFCFDFLLLIFVSNYPWLQGSFALLRRCSR